MAKIIVSKDEKDSNSKLYYGSMFILKGGSANETTIMDESSLNVSNGGRTGNVYVSSGGTMNIFKGGSAGSASIRDYGKLFVSNGGTLNVLDLQGDGYAVVCKGGYAGKVKVSAGTAVLSGTVSSAMVINENLIEVCGGVVSSASVDIFGSLTINKGTVSSASVEGQGSLTLIKGTIGSANVSGGIEVYKGGTANNVTVFDKASMTIFDGKANSVTVQGNDAWIELNGGAINGLSVEKSGVYVSSGGKVKDVTIDDLGKIEIGDATASNLTVLKGHIEVGNGGKVINATLFEGTLNASAGGIMSNVTLENAAVMSIQDDGTKVSGVTVKNGATLSLQKDTVANNVTVEKGGRITVNGTINGLTIDSGTSIGLYESATATKVKWTPGDGTFSVVYGVSMKYTSKYSGVYVGSAGSNVSRTKEFDVNLGMGESAYIAKGGLAKNVEVRNGGWMEVWSGGTATSAAIYADCDMAVSRGGIADGTQVSGYDAYLYLDGGKANNTTIKKDGKMEIYDGGSASGVTIEADGQLTIYSGTATDVDWTPFVGDLYVCEDGQVSFANELTGVYTGPGAHTNETVTGRNMTGERMYVMSSGCAANTQFQRGEIFVYGGSVVGTVYTGTLHYYGGMASMYLYDNASATDTFVKFGEMYVYSGAMAEQTKVNMEGHLYVCSGGSAVGVTVESGHVWVSNGFAGDVEVGSEAKLCVEKGGIVSSAVVSGGDYMNGAQILVSSGAVVSNLVLQPGAVLFVEKGAKVVNVSSSYGSYIAAEKGATVKIKEAIVAESKDSDHDVENGNGWENKKKKKVYESLLESKATEIHINTNEIVFDDKAMTYEGYRNFVGFGDEIDFLKIHLNNPAELSFIIEATDAAKFTIWRWDEGKKQMVSLQSTALKDFTGDPKYGKQYSIETKGLLLADTEGDYYLSVESTNASKGGNAYYNVYVNGDDSIFYDQGDHSDDWTDLPYNPNSTEYGNAGVISGVEDPLVEENWVGFDDGIDYMTFTVKDDVSMSFSFTADDAVKFTVFTVFENDNGKWEPITLLTKTVKPKKAGTEKTEFTAECQFTGDLEKTYFFSVEYLNKKKVGSGANYSVYVETYDLLTTVPDDDDPGFIDEQPFEYFDPYAVGEDSNGCALTMPESDDLAMTGSLNFGQYDTDVLADASVSALAELDGKPVWQDALLA